MIGLVPFIDSTKAKDLGIETIQTLAKYGTILKITN